MDAGVASSSLSGIGTLLSAFSSFKEGTNTSKAYKAAANSSVKNAKFEADQLNRQAGQERAASQRQAIEEKRAANKAINRAKLLAASSGAGATDPDIINIVGNIAAEGEYNALARLYTGEETARGLEDQAAAVIYNGKSEAAGYKSYAKAYKSAATGEGIGTLLSGGVSFFEKYGDPANNNDVMVQTYSKTPQRTSYWKIN